MIDPVNITKFKNTKEELEEVLLFWVLAAGKNALTASRCLEKLLQSIHNNLNIKLYNPFECIRKINKSELPNVLKYNGIGCYNNKAKTFYELANSGLDLHECSAEDLENIYGIGMKTSRCFIIHSRRNASYAGLDVHILSFLRDNGYNVPQQTPTRKSYLEIEKIFLDLVKKSGMSVAEYDLMIWREYSGRNKIQANN
jgi:thermostable 8-oxoguanine DNA glycosylase